MLKTAAFQAHWISPEGKIISVDDTDDWGTHEETADKIIESNPEYAREFNQVRQTNGSQVEYLISKGWVRARGETFEVCRIDSSILGHIEYFLSLYCRDRDEIAIEVFDGQSYEHVYQGKVGNFIHNFSKQFQLGKGKESTYKLNMERLSWTSGKDSFKDLDFNYDKDRGQQIKTWEPGYEDEGTALSPLEMHESWNTDNFNTPTIDRDKQNNDSQDPTERSNMSLWM